MAQPRSLYLHLSDTAATEDLARRLAPCLRRGDVIGLTGPIGAGKSVFARAIIKSRLQALGRDEDVPSPSFTLVQTYDLGEDEIWHCDLYRLSGGSDLVELGLDGAFEDAICLVEWPDRLAADWPQAALGLTLTPAPDGDVRHARLNWTDRDWDARLDMIGEAANAQ